MKMLIKPRSADRGDTAQEALTAQNQRRRPSRSTTPTTEFGRTLKDLLGKTFQADELNEEELFAATTHQLIRNRFGQSIADDFKSAFKLNMVDKPDSEKFASPERAAKESLRFFVNSTLIKREEAQQIRELAFATAQLDDNTDFVWDSMGDTRAVTSFAKGEKLVQQRLESSGNAPVTTSKRGRRGKASKYEPTEAPRAQRTRGRVKRSA